MGIVALSSWLEDKHCFLVFLLQGSLELHSCDAKLLAIIVRVQYLQ